MAAGSAASRPATFARPGSDGELSIVAGPGAGRAAPVRGSATIGREPECDLQVLDSEVSRRHAKVTVRDGDVFIDDLNSANGTYVNGERILGREALKPGDRIQIGQATIQLTSPAFEHAIARVPPPQVSAVRDVIEQPAKLLGAESGTRKWWTLAVVVATTFMLLLDMTIVSVALPSISRALHPSFSSLQWIVDAYTLALAALLLTAGSMADIFGRKRVLTIGLVIFLVASVACALAPTATTLVLARGVQGVGGAIMFACSLALIVQEFPAGERGVAFGVYGAVNGLSVAVGPIIGGLLVQGIGWQSIFYLNVPIGIAAFVVLQRKVVNLRGPAVQIDWLGVVTFTAGLGLATFATIRGNDDGWTSTEILACFGAAAALLAAFVAIELRTRQPMLDLGLFRNPTFIGASTSAITMSFSILALIFFLTTWLQSVLGYSPVNAGLRMLALTAPVLLIAPLAGRMTGTVTPRITLALGLGLIAVGILTMTAVKSNSSWTVILPGLCLSGLGLGIMNPTLASTAVGVVPPWRGGMASGINSTCREGGVTLGIAVLGAILLHQVRVHVKGALADTFLASSSKGIANAISVGGAPQLLAKTRPSLRPGLSETVHASYAAGLHSALLVAAAAAAVGCIAAVVLVRKRHLRAEDAEDELSALGEAGGAPPPAPAGGETAQTAKGPRAQRTIRINRPVSEVFAYIARGENNPLWRSRVIEIQLESGNGGLGTVYRQGEKGPMGRRIAADFRVTEHDPPRRYAFEIITGPARPKGTFTLTPLGELATQVDAALAWTPSGPARLIAPIVAKGMRHEMDDLDHLKLALEDRAGRGRG
jgi:EmrB/QacA subfamily drug resistance transporter